MVFKNFKYPVLAEYFEKISSIPRMSYHEEKIAEYLVGFAKERGLECYTDGANNVLINLPASEGCDNAEPLLFQGHTDMVCEKNSGAAHDFLNEGLELYEEDGYLKARGTTLGADDGVAVAVMLALIDGGASSHPACQFLFTSAEEVGLDGAKAFDYSRIFARKMINMDGADENFLIVGCAGGVRSDAHFSITRRAPSFDTILKISLGGLMGGHSGENIGDGRANANKLAGEQLRRIYRSTDTELIAFDGGTKDNAIPREAVLLVSVKDGECARGTAEEFEAKIKRSLAKDDLGFFISCENYDGEEAPLVFSSADTERIISFVSSVENGVLKMSDKIDGLVEFSRNLGIVRTDAEGIDFYFSSRSAIEEQLEASMARIETLAKELCGEVKHYNRYPGWEVSGRSPLADEYIDAAKRLFGTEVYKTALHAGLECGIVKKAVPDIEIISCGPDVRDLHSPDERLDIASFERFFAVIKEVTESIARKK